MARLAGGKTEADVLRYLQGLNFPALKHDVVHAARQNGAPSDVIASLEQLSSTEFSRPEAIIDEFPHLE